jgi:glyceraldehyde 3-phosphate dehydrogenase (phosphorylating)
VGFRIGINGLGRIGRGFLRLALDRADVEVVAINDLAEPQVLANLLRHDSLFGRAGAAIDAEGGAIRAGAGGPIRCTRVPRPSEIPWGDAGVDLVIESTGAFASRAAAAGHLVSPGGRRVLITAPSPDADLTVCFGVNHQLYDPDRHRVLSSASCTTNGMAVVLSVVDEAFGIDRVAMTTVHCYTNNQMLMDAPHRDPRRARAAGISMIPTSTSAAAAIVQVLPALAGKVQALAVRVPVAAVSLLDFTVQLRRPATIEAARAVFRRAAEGRLEGILGYEQEELVSIDFLGDSRSAVIDAPLLSVEGDRLLKVYAWYDNERGYVGRLLDLIRHMGRGAASGGPEGHR